jgi:hypothetical protein
MAASTPALMMAREEGHERRQVGKGEIGGAEAGVEPADAEVDGVGAVFHGGAGAFPIAGGGKEFRASHGRVLPRSARRARRK